MWISEGGRVGGIRANFDVVASDQHVGEAQLVSLVRPEPEPVLQQSERLCGVGGGSVHDNRAGVHAADPRP